MNIAVKYFTQSGNTKKIADAVANALSVQATSIDNQLDEKADLLFLGSSLYKFGVEPAVAAFIERNANHIGKIALFGTSASGGSTYKQVAAIADRYGIPMCEKEFVCLGHFLFLHKDRPNADDCAAAAQFAQEIAAQ